MHILHDERLGSVSEPCGFCLRPSPMCIFHLKKGKGVNANLRVDKATSTCPNLTSFNYGVAMVSTAASPSSNVPISCPFCVSSTPAVWKYNMKDHLVNKHPSISLPGQRKLWEISQSEQDLLEAMWRSRGTKKKGRNSRKKTKTALVISEAHSSRLTLSCVSVLCLQPVI